MKKIMYYYAVVFSVLFFTACDRKTNETQATEKKKDGPVFELKEEIQAPQSDTTALQKDSLER